MSVLYNCLLVAIILMATHSIRAKDRPKVIVDGRLTFYEAEAYDEYEGKKAALKAAHRSVRSKAGKIYLEDFGYWSTAVTVNGAKVEAMIADTLKISIVNNKWLESIGLAADWLLDRELVAADDTLEWDETLEIATAIRTLKVAHVKIQIGPYSASVSAYVFPWPMWENNVILGADALTLLALNLQFDEPGRGELVGSLGQLPLKWIDVESAESDRKREKTDKPNDIVTTFAELAAGRQEAVDHLSERFDSEPHCWRTPATINGERASAAILHSLRMTMISRTWVEENGLFIDRVRHSPSSSDELDAEDDPEMPDSIDVVDVNIRIGPYSTSMRILVHEISFPAFDIVLGADALAQLQLTGRSQTAEAYFLNGPKGTVLLERVELGRVKEDQEHSDDEKWERAEL